MKILVTGSYGQLGNEIRVALQQFPDTEVIMTDVDTLDICNKNAVERFFEQNKPDFIVNCAAYTAVDKAENDVDLCYKINRDAVENLAKSAAKIGAKIVHISTDYVFDGTANVPYSEDVKVCPKSIYGKSKAAGEEVLMENNGQNSIIIRTAWLYSIFGNNFVKTMLRLGAEKEQISVVFDQIGTPTNAADLAKAIVEIIHTKTFVSGIYHFSNEGVCSWYDFTKAIFDIKKYDCKLLPIESSQYPVPAPRPSFSVLNKAKIKSVFGIEIPHWHDSLLKMTEKN
ncbi:MAG: dTDP-4-dehydrorhamnose reductase [Prevotellaceae bacterium]|jgi:dTDP-4-dehydrorhamnose reductase|nr:dTDP-4-dehydrorhamnose reductase [Prevotellaceae bacterium]